MVDLLDDESKLEFELQDDHSIHLGKRSMANISIPMTESSGLFGHHHPEKKLKLSLTNEIQGLIQKGKLQSKFRNNVQRSIKWGY